MADEKPAEPHGDTLRQAVQQELADKLRSHQDHVAAITGQQYGVRRASHASAATALGSIDSGFASESPGGRRDAISSPAQDNLSPYTAAPMATAAAPPLAINPDNNMAEEQDLEPDEIDSDSALGSDTTSITTSLSESIYNYRKEHGRTYHAYKDGKYIFPNDERENDRLDLQHHLLRITYANRLFFSPLGKPKRCLDVGTGTGIWAIDFADEFPECEVLGIDLSPGQPTLVPPNVKFVVDDAEDLWLYDEKFDFVHVRLMSGCFSDWPNFIRQAYE
ncbi:Methyltransferase pytC [Fulvia fulva]|uniref:Methyltransferase pytC n=1 Tax=Passalora fulva TaxID=5499 RepID=A0A9Q8LJM8_PASFU|nr:Methyltransferase pytC [Fulvia fulva]KAK4624293.1 Methyltransferase pytC [Fulvia fulva]KAK4625849.1 Methyltransferase pytC [Fulvia fulva]UJO17888.1 Methyltransferase pytC [Fulvia fulva]WPV14588.1 Methyltransferase pytC [Fulvia fulva]WPV29829.1 Methyltransferase pytC [Fulvia fulva]